MAIPVSSVSQVCRSIADFVSDRLEAARHNIQVRIGSPAAAAPSHGDTEHRVNLFFYRVEPNAFSPAASPDETWLLRLSCLVTSFGVDEDQVSAGENDLRLLGAVLSAFHERPVLDPIAVDGITIRSEVVFQPLDLDDVNHLWATQREVAYRPSVAYEVSLVPIPPRHPRLGAPLVGGLGVDVRSDAAGREGPFGGSAVVPTVGRHDVDIRREGWTPRLCFVVAGSCLESVSLAVGSPELAAFAPRVWVAGMEGAAVRLSWEVWDAGAGWRADAAVVDAQASGPLLDPEGVAGAPTTEVALPFDGRPGQAVLFAERTYRRGTDGATIRVRSNPILVNLF